MPAIRNILIVVSLFIQAAFAGELSNRFVSTNLAGGVSIDLPKSWLIIDGEDMKPFEDAAGAMLDLSPYAKAAQGVTRLITVGTLSDEDVVKLTIIQLPHATAQYDTISSWSKESVSQYDEATRSGLQQSGVRYTAWNGTRKVALGKSRTGLVSQYTRQGRTQEATVLMFTIFGKKRVFNATFSCPTTLLPIFQPIFQRIITSFEY